MSETAKVEAWPEAPAEGWLTTCGTIHMWAQIVGKVRIARAPMLNHWWQATFYLTARGLTTSPIPYGGRAFQIDFDFLAHRLLIATSDGGTEEMRLAPCPLPEFYAEFRARLRALGFDVPIWPMPQEVAEPVPFDKDPRHSEYDPAIAERLFQILLRVSMALEATRTAFLGKSTPVHLFWGGFDIALTRFSGRRAPRHPGGVPHLADSVTRESYSHEVASAGFWPGTAGGFERPAFYAYAYPSPQGFAEAKVRPAAAHYSTKLQEFLLPYDEVRRLADPAGAVKEFVETTYRAAADLGGWDRAGLERDFGG